MLPAREKRYDITAYFTQGPEYGNVDILNPVVDRAPVAWVLERTGESGRVDLQEYDPYELVVVYELTYIYSPIVCLRSGLLNPN